MRRMVVRCKSRGVNLLAYWLIIPALVGLVIMYLMPMMWTFYLSFTNATPLKAYHFIGIGNYVRMFQDSVFRKALINTITYTFLTVIVQVVISFVLALLINALRHGKSLARTLLLLPWAVPPVAAAQVWRWMYVRKYGVMDWFFAHLNINPPDWLGDPSIALFSVIIPTIWRVTPFMTFVLYSGLHMIPAELYEAARIDGAGFWRQLRYVTLPLMSRLFFIVILLQSAWLFSSFDIPWVLTRGGPAQSTHLLATYVYQSAFSFFDFGYAACIGVGMFGFWTAVVCLAVLIKWRKR